MNNLKFLEDDLDLSFERKNNLTLSFLCLSKLLEVKNPSIKNLPPSLLTTPIDNTRIEHNWYASQDVKKIELLVIGSLYNENDEMLSVMMREYDRFYGDGENIKMSYLSIHIITYFHLPYSEFEEYVRYILERIPPKYINIDDLCKELSFNGCMKEYKPLLLERNLVSQNTRNKSVAIVK